MSESNEALERCWGIEKLLDTLLPALIDASPGQAQIRAELAAMTRPELADSTFPEDRIAAELAAELLGRLPAH